MKGTRAIIIFTVSVCVLVGRVSADFLQESITVSAVVPYNMSTGYTTEQPSPYIPLTTGVPLTVIAGTDTVILKGVAYPDSIITLLKNGVVSDSFPANLDGTFEVRVRNLSPGVYSFALRAEDTSRLSSSLEVFTVYIANGVTTLVEGIFISPTITTDKLAVAFGKNLVLRGTSVPRASVAIVFSPYFSVVKKVQAGDRGVWVYVLDTSELTIGKHTATARSTIGSSDSSLSDEVSFEVGSQDIYRKSTALTLGSHAKCDLNGDNKVNLHDFSIMAYWYNRNGFPESIDLNSDSKLNLTDFSILAFCWTG